MKCKYKKFTNPFRLIFLCQIVCQQDTKLPIYTEHRSGLNIVKLDFAFLTSSQH